ncbi:hypothetical protein AgCh_012845 [Apium graveolens]
MRQRRWLELIKDYDCSINYQSGKANMVADTLSRKERPNMVQIAEDLARHLEKMEIDVRVPKKGKEQLYEINFQPTLMEKIKRFQEGVMEQELDNMTGEELCTQKDNQVMFGFSSRIWIPNLTELKNEFLHEAHNSQFSIHPGSTKMYQDLKKNFWWPGMKKDIANWSTLATARGDNFYYPPEWTPDQGYLNKFNGQHAFRERAMKLDQGILIIRVFLISSINNYAVAGWTCHIENVAHFKQKYGLGKNANEVIIILEAYCTLRDRGPYPADLRFKESKRGGSEIPKQKGP